MGGVFINYRSGGGREQIVDDLQERLIAHFGAGQAFVDRSSIPKGADYRLELDGRLKDCDVVLAVIHDTWTADLKPEPDWVIRELTLAFTLGKTVIPVLLHEKVRLSADRLEPPVNVLVYQQAHLITRPLEELTGRLDQLVRMPWQPGKRVRVSQFHPRRMVGYVAALLALAGVTLPKLLVPVHAREVVAETVALSLLLMVIPVLALIVLFLTKGMINRGEQGVQEMRLGEYYRRVAIPLGVLGIVLIAAMVVGLRPSWDVLPLLVFGVIVAVMAVMFTMNADRRAERRREDEWPQLLPLPIKWAHVRRELARLRRRMAAVPPDLPLGRELRERLRTSLDDLTGAVGTLRLDAGRGRVRWVVEDHHVLLWVASTWIAATIGAMFAVASPQHRLVALTVTAGASAVLALATLEIGYRRQRWLRRTIADETQVAVGELENDYTSMTERRS